jgi:hypothetical protein
LKIYLRINADATSRPLFKARSVLIITFSRNFAPCIPSDHSSWTTVKQRFELLRGIRHVFSLYTGSESHPVFWPVGSVGYFPSIKRCGGRTTQLHQVVRLWMHGFIPTLLGMASRCTVSLGKGQLYIYRYPFCLSLFLFHPRRSQNHVNLREFLLPFSSKTSLVLLAVLRPKYSAFGKSLCNYKMWWKWCSRASMQAWTRLILLANTFCRSAFGKSLCTYKRCWEWYSQASMQAWTRLILLSNTFCRSAFGKSLCAYQTRWNDFDGRHSIESEMSINFLSFSLDGLPIRPTSNTEFVPGNFSVSQWIALDEVPVFLGTF